MSDTTKTRSLRELGQVLLDNQEFFKTGLCHWLHVLETKPIISLSEEGLIHALVEARAPKPRFGWMKAYRWPKGEIQPRIDFINEHMINAEV